MNTPGIFQIESGQKNIDMEVGDIVEVKKKNGTGMMHVVRINENTFMGRYVYQKMGMYDQYREKGRLIEKMKKFVIRVVRKREESKIVL